jgi:secondary thiamine-phosphate synthase enzyme
MLGLLVGTVLRPHEFMKQATFNLIVRTRGRGLIDCTASVNAWLKDQPVRTGLLTVFCTHTSASLLIQENAAPEVRSDLLAFFERIAPDDSALYDHNDEGPDDMPAHIRSAVTQVSISVPVQYGRLALGTWQAIYLFEHRLRPQGRTLVLHLLGE